jgi:AraC-like DNA-binding protein
MTKLSTSFIFKSTSMFDLSPLYAKMQPNVDLGSVETYVPHTHVFWSRCASKRQAQTYQLGLVFILQGHKVGYLGARRFEYGAGHYLAVGLPILFECETYAEAQAPLLGLFVALENAELSSLVAQMSTHRAIPVHSHEHAGVEPLHITPALTEPLTRIIQVMDDPKAGPVLGALYVKELLYHVLQDANSSVLLAHLNRTTPHNRVAEAVQYLSDHLHLHLSVPALAERAHMSVASFNRHFKTLTGHSVVQYVKALRLMRGRHLLTLEGQSVSQTAQQVGYSSAAQFSRDFKTFFQMPPKSARQNEIR